jgi:hypothetical protein
MIAGMHVASSVFDGLMWFAFATSTTELSTDARDRLAALIAIARKQGR